MLKEDTSQSYSDEERKLCGHLYQALVCEGCSGWYDDPVLAHKEA